MDRNNKGEHSVAVPAVATREGGVDRNCLGITHTRLGQSSPPARVAWIETNQDQNCNSRELVATREGGVDRNVPAALEIREKAMVATREGGVDRNVQGDAVLVVAGVATREGGVDRNISRLGILHGGTASPPARVAWIETEPYRKEKMNGTCRHPRGWRG